VKVAAILAALAAALALQTTMARYLGERGAVVDFTLVVVVMVALTWGPLAGLLCGSMAGLLQDSLSGGILGLGGLVKTIVGFAVGVAGSQFIVTQAFSRFLVFAGASVLQGLCFLAFLYVIEGRPYGPAYRVLLTQASATALTGVLAFKAAEGLPGAVERRRTRRPSSPGRWS
jgi:rod shape-determining protein MreD